MKRLTLISLLGAMLLSLGACKPHESHKLVILHTNDTHSMIDPDDKDDLGGVARRKVLIDSIREAEPNSMVIDAGDVVQGTLYFNLFGGEVENKAMNAMGYDLRVLGNHEFDNGMEGLEKMLDLADSQWLATNYDLSGSNIADRFDKYAIKDFGGKKIGFIGVNLNPKGMISEGNYDGVVYEDAIATANATAKMLKDDKKVDMVIAVTHIGYDPATPPGDLLLAKSSEDIDIIIGGHSHDLIDPTKDNYQYRVPNLRGRDVLITQVGKSGKNVGEITIDLDKLTADYRVIPVDSRLDSRLDSTMVRLIQPYRASIDSLMADPVGTTAMELDQRSTELLNWSTDVVMARGKQLAQGVDFAILNKGGIRRGLPLGTITRGQIMTMLPFNNTVEVIDIKGEDLLKAFEQMAKVGGNGVSDGVVIEYEPSDPSHDEDPEIESVTINGKKLDEDKTYRVATIDYLSGGGDYMPTLANHTLVAKSNQILYNDMLDYLKANPQPIKPLGTPRFKKVK